MHIPERGRDVGLAESVFAPERAVLARWISIDRLRLDRYACLQIAATSPIDLGVLRLGRPLTTKRFSSSDKSGLSALISSQKAW